MVSKNIVNKQSDIVNKQSGRLGFNVMSFIVSIFVAPPLLGYLYYLNYYTTKNVEKLQTDIKDFSDTLGSVISAVSDHAYKMNNNMNKVQDNVNSFMSTTNEKFYKQGEKMEQHDAILNELNKETKKQREETNKQREETNKLSKKVNIYGEEIKILTSRVNGLYSRIPNGVVDTENNVSELNNTENNTLVSDDQNVDSQNKGNQDDSQVQDNKDKSQVQDNKDKSQVQDNKDKSQENNVFQRNVEDWNNSSTIDPECHKEHPENTYDSNKYDDGMSHTENKAIIEQDKDSIQYTKTQINNIQNSINKLYDRACNCDYRWAFGGGFKFDDFINNFTGSSILSSLNKKEQVSESRFSNVKQCEFNDADYRIFILSRYNNSIGKNKWFYFSCFDEPTIFAKEICKKGVIFASIYFNFVELNIINSTFLKIQLSLLSSLFFPFVFRVELCEAGCCDCYNGMFEINKDIFIVNLRFQLWIINLNLYYNIMSLFYKFINEKSILCFLGGMRDGLNKYFYYTKTNQDVNKINKNETDEVETYEFKDGVRSILFNDCETMKYGLLLSLV